ARLTGLGIIFGASMVALGMSDVFGQFKLAIELPIVFAAPFWVGLYWRRVNTTAVWITSSTTAIVFFVLPIALSFSEELRVSPSFGATTYLETRSLTRPATAADVARYEAWRELVEQEGTDEAGPPPANAVLGEPTEFVTKRGGASIFWKGGVESLDGGEVLELVEERMEGETRVLVQKRVDAVRGIGWFNVDYVIYHWLGFDLAAYSKATLETLRLPLRVAFPFLLLISVSYLTPRNSKTALDRYYAKMNTEVDPDPRRDQEKLASAYEDPTQFADRKLFGRGDLEFTKPRPKELDRFSDLRGRLLCGDWVIDMACRNWRDLENIVGDVQEYALKPTR
ncbi:MAG: hypothetical protein AAFX06_06800, partial [Planctomycetota bacterium]